MTSEWDKLQDEAKYINHEKNVFSCKVLSVIKEQRKKEQGNGKIQIKIMSNYILLTKIPPAVSINVSASAFCSK